MVKEKKAGIGRAVKILRMCSCQSSKELAEKMNVSPVQISQIETGRAHGTIDFVGTFAKAFGIETSELISFAEKLKKNPQIEKAIFENVKKTIKGL